VLRLHRTSIAFVAALILVASACSSQAPATTGATPQTGKGAAEESLTTPTLGKVGTTILKEVTAGVLQGIGAFAFNWVESLISPDPTPQQISDIQAGVGRLEQDVAKLSSDVQSMRSDMDRDFKNQQGVIQDQSTAEDRKVIDDAVGDLNRFTTETKSALANHTPVPDPKTSLGSWGNPKQLSALYYALDHNLHNELTQGGSNTGGGSLISTADSIFAGQQRDAELSKTGLAFDDRPLWQRLGLQEGAAPDEIKKACDDLHTRQPASAICVSPGPGNQPTPTVSYYDRMQTFINYYVNYQVTGLQVFTTALFAVNCPRTPPGTSSTTTAPTADDCALARTIAQETTTRVVTNVRQQLAMAGFPVSTSDRVLEQSGTDTATLWRTNTTPATFAQLSRPTPPTGGTEWYVPIDCALSGNVSGTLRPDVGIPCSVKDTPYTVAVPSQRPEDQICVGAPTEGKDVATKQKQPNDNGVFDALPAEWSACARPAAFASAPATGLRVPTHAEMASAVAKNPENWILSLAGEPSFGTAPYLSHTPAEVSCGQTVPDDQHNPFYGAHWRMTPVNTQFNRWIGGWATTWSKTTAWSEARQFNWTAPRVFQFDTNDFEAAAGYPADGPCERRPGNFDGDGKGDKLITYGWSQCVVNDATEHDWCYGHRNYLGNALPAAGSDLRVWGAYSLITCPQQQVDAGTGTRGSAFEVTGCGPDTHPSGKDWEVPACKTPAGEWTQCGTAWVDALLPPAPAATVSTTTSTPPITAKLSTTTSTPGITAKLSTTTTAATTVPSTTTPVITAKLSTTTTVPSP